MLHACFQLLKDCVEQENLISGDIDWTYTSDQQKAKETIIELYDWWKERIKQENEYYYLEYEHYDEDNEQLHNLIEIRKYLWT